MINVDRFIEIKIHGKNEDALHGQDDITLYVALNNYADESDKNEDIEIQFRNEEEDCWPRFRATKEDAIFLAKSILAYYEKI
jgi:hypothetical protein